MPALSLKEATALKIKREEAKAKQRAKERQAKQQGGRCSNGL